MQIIIKGTNIDLTDGIRSHINEKIGGVKKFFPTDNSGGVSAPSIARVEVGLISTHHKSGKIFRAEVNLSMPGNFIRAEAESDDLYRAIDMVRSKLERELDGMKKGEVSKKHRAAVVWKKLQSISPVAWLKNEFRKGRRGKEKF